MDAASAAASRFGQFARAKESLINNVGVFRQAADCRNRHCDPDDARWWRLHSGVANRAVSANRAAGSSGPHALHRRGRADYRAIRRRADRAADEWRGQHELHVFDQRQHRRHADDRQFRCRHGCECRSNPRAVARVAGAIAIAAGQVGSEPIPSGQKFTYTVRAQGRLQTPEEFGEIVVRANPDGSFVRVKDIARIDLGAQTYNLKGRLNGQPAAVLACYQLPGSNAVKAAQGVRQVMAEAKQRFPADMDFAVSLDKTLSVTEGLRDIVKTLFEALALVVIVVFVFLQGWRATLIPLCAVRVSLLGTVVMFPLFGFSINTLSLFGLVLAIVLVVDDAIVVVEAVERHIEEGMAPREATLQAMREVSGLVIGIALVL